MIINKFKYYFYFFTSLVLLSACQHEKTNNHLHQLFVFGTLVDINIWHDDVNTINNAIDKISETFNQMHQQWHAWKPGRLQKINHALQQGKSLMLSEDEAFFIQKTIDYSLASEHLFNPTIGKVINLWGFHTDDYPIRTPPPDQAVINQLIASGLDVSVLQLKDQQISSNNPNIWLDFGGIAKGYAIDVAVTILQEHGINDAIINAGGDLRSMGSKGKKAWRIAIQSPKDWTALAEFTVKGDESVFTSGNYQRYKEFDGERYAHIIDPRTGMPVEDIVSATVIAENGIQADAAATALVVAGKDWYQTAQAMGIEQALIIDDQHQCFVTQAFFNRLENLKISCEVIN